MERGITTVGARGSRIAGSARFLEPLSNSELVPAAGWKTGGGGDEGGGRGGGSGDGAAGGDGCRQQ